MRRALCFALKRHKAMILLARASKKEPIAAVDEACYKAAAMRSTKNKTPLSLEEAKLVINALYGYRETAASMLRQAQGKPAQEAQEALLKQIEDLLKKMEAAWFPPT